MTYKEIDRWIDKHPADALSLGVKKNCQWCYDDFLTYANKSLFAEKFNQKAEKYLQEKLQASCPATGQTFVCTEADKQMVCEDAMRRVDQPISRCALAAVPPAQAADFVADYLNANSQVPFSIVRHLPAKPDEIICTRPGQRRKGESYYQAHFDNLSATCLEFKLNEDQTYSALKQQVAAVVTGLKSSYPGSAVSINSADPLLVRFTKAGSGPTLAQTAQSEPLVEAALNQRPEAYPPFGPPSTQAWFDVVNGEIASLPFDGLSTPTVEVIIGGLKKIKPSGSGLGQITSANQKEIKGQTAAQRLKGQLQNGGFAPNPVDSNPDGQGGGMPGVPGTGPDLHGMGGFQGLGKGSVVSPGGMTSGGTGIGEHSSLGIGETGAGSLQKNGPGLTVSPGDVAGKGPGDFSSPINQKNIGINKGYTSGGPSLTTDITQKQSQLQVQGLASGHMVSGVPVNAAGTPQVSTGSTAPAPMSAPMSLPDITISNPVTIGGKEARWGGSLTLDAATALKINGICRYPLKYIVRNAGSGPAQPFTGSWSCGGNTWIKQFPMISPGSSSTQNDTIELKPGKQTLKLKVDHGAQVKETDETNNEVQLQLNVTGICSNTVKPVTPVAPLGRPPIKKSR
ncbi:MAG: CARDB domain-containing protein [Pseudomonadota bacterium]